MSKEDIEILEKYANFNEVVGTRRLQQAVQNMLKENKTNKKKINELEIVILKDYISKFIIKETIEQLKAEYIKELDKNSIRAFILKCKIEGLEELLKDGGE